jgi:hypothetical protein
MAIAIYSSKPGKHGCVGVTHVFFGEDEEAAWAALEAHAAICPKFGPAYESSETIEIVVEIDIIPEFDSNDLQDFFDIPYDEEDELESEG